MDYSFGQDCKCNNVCQEGRLMIRISRSKQHTEHRGQKGFTIVELMVATLVFSVVLLVVTVGIMQFTRSYYRGAIQAKTQDTARTVIDNITQSLQFGLAEPDIGVNPDDQTIGYFCAGGYRFAFTKGVK